MRIKANKLLVFLTGVVLVGGVMFSIPFNVYAVGFCPCNYAGAVRARALNGNEMRCSSTDVDIFNVPPEGTTSKQNHKLSCSPFIS